MRIEKKNQLQDVVSFFMGAGVFLSLGPYFMWNTGLYKVFTVPVSVLFFWYVYVQGKIKAGYLFLAWFFAFSIIILGFSSVGVVLYFNSSMLLVLIFLSADNTVKVKTFYFFRGIYAFFLILGLFVYLLCLIGVVLPWSSLTPISLTRADNGVFYRNYLFSLALSTEVFNAGFGEIYRFASLYDEPGVVGTVSALLLVVSRFDLRSISSKIILISGLVSFSLAFYVLSGVYIILQRRDLLVKLVLPSLGFVFMFYDQLKTNGLLFRFLFNRFGLLFSNPQLVNNRADDCFMVEYYRYLQSWDVFFGRGYWAHAYMGCDVSSGLSLIYNHGLFGFALVVVFYILLYMVLMYKVKPLCSLAPFFIVFTLSLYQRPEYFSVFMVAIFSVAILKSSRIDILIDGCGGLGVKKNTRFRGSH